MDGWPDGEKEPLGMGIKQRRKISIIHCKRGKFWNRYRYQKWKNITYMYKNLFLPMYQLALVVKNLPDNARDIRDMGSIPRSGRSPRKGHGNPLQYSCLENPMDREARQAIVHRVTKNQTQVISNACTGVMRVCIFPKKICQISFSPH